MKKAAHILQILATLLLISGVAATGENAEPVASSPNPPVIATVRIPNQPLAGGQTGEMVIALRPAEGFHINAEPPVRVSLDSAATVSLVGEPLQIVAETTGYLDPEAEVKQRFRVTKNAAAGTHRLKITITYFYCSDSEGWCRPFRHPVELTLLVKPDPVKH